MYGYRMVRGLPFGLPVSKKKEVPIVDGMPELGTQMQIIWKDQFVSGVETPLLSLLLSLSIAIFLFARKEENQAKCLFLIQNKITADPLVTFS